MTIETVNGMEIGNPAPGESAARQAETPDRLLAALIAQGGAESVREVRVRGKVLPL
jgi:hypothetical protein